MTTKEKRGKAIIGIAMAAVMLASVFAAIVPMGMTRTPTNPAQIVTAETIYIGEKGLAFDVDGDGDFGDAGTPDVGSLEGVPGTATDGESPLLLSPAYTVPDVTEGKYYHDANGNGALEAGEFFIYVDKAEIKGDIILNNRAQDSVVRKSVPTGAEIVFKVEPNFGGKIPGAQIKINVMDPNNVEVLSIDGVSLSNIDASTTSFFISEAFPAGTTTAPPHGAPGGLDLTDLKTGEYRVIMETEKTYCNMLDIKSPEYTFKVRSEELSIEAVEDTVGVGEDMIVKVTGNPTAYYYLTVTGVDVDAPPEINAAGDVKARSGAAVISATAPNLAAWVETEEDGIADVTISTTAADDRTYTVHVYETTFVAAPCPGPATYDSDANVAASALTTDDDDVDIKVEKAKVTFDIPIHVTTGEVVEIKGAITAGEYVDIVIEDANEVVDNEAVDENKEFHVKWDTSGMATGSYTIEVYIDMAPALGTEEPDNPPAGPSPSDYTGLDEDGSTTIRLIAPELTARQLRNAVAEDDDYTIEGTATGVDDIDIVLVGPEGYPAADQDFDVLNGLEITSTSVRDDEFSEDIEMAEGLDYGTWITMVFSAGRDGVYGDWYYEAGRLADLFDGDPVRLNGKSQSQIVTQIKDCTIDTVGSDDLLVEFPFVVEMPYVEFNPIESVTIGEPLELTGITNREPETVIMISTCAGPMDFPAVMTRVEWSTSDQGIFTATIDTTYALPGTYTFEADDGDGHTDKATVELLPAVSTFDTGAGTYPSISGTHNGTIIPARDLNVSTLYTYPGPGTGGHTKSIALYEHNIPVAYGTWSGYTGDWYNVTLHNVSGAPYVMLREDHEYNYTLRTGSYPQIIHRQNHTTLDGSFITCTEFIDANGRRYSNWIPAIRLV